MASYVYKGDSSLIDTIVDHVLDTSRSVTTPRNQFLHAGKDTESHLNSSTLVPTNITPRNKFRHAGRDTGGSMALGSMVPLTTPRRNKFQHAGKDTASHLEPSSCKPLASPFVSSQQRPATPEMGQSPFAYVSAAAAHHVANSARPSTATSFRSTPQQRQATRSRQEEFEQGTQPAMELYVDVDEVKRLDQMNRPAPRHPGAYMRPTTASTTRSQETARQTRTRMAKKNKPSSLSVRHTLDNKPSKGRKPQRKTRGRRRKKINQPRPETANANTYDADNALMSHDLTPRVRKWGRARENRTTADCRKLVHVRERTNTGRKHVKPPVPQLALEDLDLDLPVALTINDDVDKAEELSISDIVNDETITQLSDRFNQHVNMSCDDTNVESAVVQGIPAVRTPWATSSSPSSSSITVPSHIMTDVALKKKLRYRRHPSDVSDAFLFHQSQDQENVVNHSTENEAFLIDPRPQEIVHGPRVAQAWQSSYSSSYQQPSSRLHQRPSTSPSSSSSNSFTQQQVYTPATRSQDPMPPSRQTQRGVVRNNIISNIYEDDAALESTSVQQPTRRPNDQHYSGANSVASFVHDSEMTQWPPQTAYSELGSARSSSSTPSSFSPTLAPSQAKSSSPSPSPSSGVAAVMQSPPPAIKSSKYWASRIEQELNTPPFMKQKKHTHKEMIRGKRHFVRTQRRTNILTWR